MDDRELFVAMIAELLRGANVWIDFRTLARRLVGDVTTEPLLAGIAEARPDTFVVHANRRVKLTQAAVAQFAQVLQVPRPPISTSPQREAAAAVRGYASQLRPLLLAVGSIGPSRLVLERYLHEVRLEMPDDDVRVVDDTPVSLVSQSGRRNDGHVVGVSRDEAVLYVAFFEQVLPAVDLPAILEVNRSRPLIAMAERLAAIEQPVPHFQTMIAAASGLALSHDDSEEVAQLLSLIGQPWMRLLWGPPGAGKTRCVATFTRSLLLTARDERVLLVAPSNVAVDAALAELIAALEGTGTTQDFLSRHLVARFGYSRDERILARHEVFGPPELEELSKQIAAGFKELRHRVEHGEPAEVLAELKAIIQQLQQKRRQKMAAFLSSARVVATTIASVLVAESPVIGAGPWQTVIVDEASMINGASALLLASAATKRFLVAGDPRQLGPIFEWQGNAPEPIVRWCATDPYELAGVSTGSGLQRTIETNDTRLARILSQRRCHPDIWRLVEDLYPKVTSVVDGPRLAAIAGCPPRPGSAAVVLDLSGGRPAPPTLREELAADVVAVEYESACRKVGGSWENPPTAMLAIDVAREIRAHNSDTRIAIIAPYRAQVRLLRRWLDAETKADPRLKGIEVGTVHAFQGGESDAVIFDIVDGPPRSRPGLLLRDDTGMRLVNVAVTRARGKLVMLAHLTWLANDAGLLGKILFGAERCDVIPPPQVEPYPQGSGGSDDARPESPIEQLLVDELTKRHDVLPPFVLQHRIHNEQGRIVSRADVAFVNERMAIYCDGAIYHLKKDQWQRDQRQRRELTRLGWRVLTFTGSELTADPSRAADEIVRVLRSTRAENQTNERPPTDASGPGQNSEHLNIRQRRSQRRAMAHAQNQPAAQNQSDLGEPSSQRAAARFVVTDSGYGALDQKTGLTWTRTPLDREMTFAEAQNAARSFNVGGHAWRLPKRDELLELITAQRALPPAERPFSELPRWWFWSSQRDEGSRDLAWAVSASTIESRTCHVATNKFWVLLVLDSPQT